MNTFKYAAREYVPSIDLTTLGNTYNTLERGHQEAVKAVSDLETAVANLDMNEAEDGFKQQLVNEIKNTVDANTVYGNSYGALDDIVLKAGNIASDGRVIGRLRSQQAKKAYDAQVDKMAIPEGMKQMYKEENPYHYEDGAVDANTGRVLPGSVWQPNSRPVNTIDFFALQKQALSVAAKEAGGGERVTFLNANGQEVTDPRQSADGAIYRKVGTKYERLGADKISKAIRTAIANTPGATDSLQQDYKYENWQRDKLVDDARGKGSDENPYVQGLTDKQGNVYSYDQWLNNKIQGFADVSAYNHATTSVDYGTALQNRQARLSANAAASGGNSRLDRESRGLGVVVAGTREVEVNAFAGAQNAKSVANNKVVSTFNNYFKNGLKIGNKTLKGVDSVSDIIQFLKNNTNTVKGPGGAANYLIQQINNNGGNLSKDERLKITNAFMGYYNANTQMSKMLSAAGENADALRFSSNVTNNDFTSDNKYGKAIIDSMNKVFKNGNTVRYTIGKDVMSGLKSKYNVRTDDEFRKLGFNLTLNSDGTYEVIINSDNRNLYPKFATSIADVKDELPGTLGTWITNTLGFSVADNGYQSSILDNNGRSVWRKTGNAPVIEYDIRRLYNNGMEAAANIENKIGIGKGIVNIDAYDDSSYGALYYRLNKDKFTREELNDYIVKSNERVDNMFSTGNFDSGVIREFDRAGNSTKNIADAQDIKLLLQRMYSDDTFKKQIKRSVLAPETGVLGQPKGYTVSFTVPKGAETGKYKEGQQVKFAVYGVVGEENDFDPSYNPDVLSTNTMAVARATNSNVENLGYTDNLGDTRLTPQSNGTYKSSFMGKNITLNANQAKKFISDMYSFSYIKNQYYNGLYGNTREDIQLLDNSIQELAIDLAKVVNTNPNSLNNTAQDIYESLCNEFNIKPD